MTKFKSVLETNIMAAVLVSRTFRCVLYHLQCAEVLRSVRNKRSCS